MKNLFSLCLLFISILCWCTSKIPSSDSENEYSIFIDFSHRGMEPKMEYLFDSFGSLPGDSIGKNCCIDIAVRYSDMCNLKALPLNIEVISQTDSISNYKIDFPLFNTYDTKAGKGNFGIYEKKLPLFSKPISSQVLQIAISTNEKNTKGILSLGIICKKI